MIYKENEIVVDDIKLASALLVTGHEVVRPAQMISYSNRDVLNFYFERSQKLIDDIQSFRDIDDSEIGKLANVFDVHFNIIADIKKAERVAVMQKNGSTAYISNRLTDKQKEQLLKRL